MLTGPGRGSPPRPGGAAWRWVLVGAFEFDGDPARRIGINTGSKVRRNTTVPSASRAKAQRMSHGHEGIHAPASPRVLPGGTTDQPRNPNLRSREVVDRPSTSGTITTLPPRASTTSLPTTCSGAQSPPLTRMSGCTSLMSS